MFLSFEICYSCTTSGSSMTAIYQHYAQRETESNMKWSVIDRWPTNKKLVETFATNIRNVLDTFPEEKRKEVVLLFSAHSVPQYVMDRGDPYPAEVGATVSLVMEALNWCNPYRLVWQSKVGPLPWLKPGTEDTIEALVKRGQKNLMLIPIAFVNEHIETLHELDIEYAKDIGEKVGAERIARCPAPNDNPIFIEGLANIVHQHLTQGPRVNPQLLLRCPMCTNPNCGKTKNWLSKMTKA